MIDINANDTLLASQLKQNSNLKNLNVKNLQNDELRKVCDDFEAFFTQQFLDISLKSSNLAGDGAGSDIIKGMYTEALSKSATGTFGISEMLYNFLSEGNK